MAKGDNLQERIIDFAVRIITLTAKFPNNAAGRHIADQLMRSGTAAAPNYSEARGAESTKDFIHKLKIAFKELNESEVWLKITQRSQLIQDSQLQPTLSECNELQKILAVSIRTAMKKMV